MRRVEGRIVLSATDLTKHVACPHITTLDLGDLDPQPALDSPIPDAPDDALDLVFTKGLAHERVYLERLRGEGRIIEQIDGFGGVAAAQTLAAMRAGADVVYQACLADSGWLGYADFLLRVDTPDNPSALGPWRYDIADTKLARRLNVAALLQMATYAQRLETLQGVAPQRLIVVTGDGVENAWAPRDVGAYARRVAARLEAAVADQQPTEAAPNPHCKQCRWASHCAGGWERGDDVGLVAGIRRDHRAALREAGVVTLSQLATTDPADLVGVLSPGLARRVTQQARLQLTERTTGEPTYELLDPQPHLGLGLLPAPHPHDVYLDFEGNPWGSGGEGIEYLAGLLDRSQRFFTWWAHDPEEEKALVEGLLDDLVARHRANPGMHIYHYAPYERTALARMTARYGTREAELDELLRAQVFVDLYAVVRQGLRISKGSYSIKKLEAFYWQHTRTAADGEVADALSSVVEYERWLSTRDQQILDAIAEYNRQDVLSTLALHDWLEERRDELVRAGRAGPRAGGETTGGGTRGGEPAEGAAVAGADSAEPVPAAAVPVDAVPVDPKAAERARREAERAEQASEREQAEEQLAERLRDAGHPLAAACVGWHRREQRPAWWEYFRFGQLTTDELVADPKALADLGEPEHVGNVLDKRGRAGSKIWRYPLPPQDYSGRRGDSLPCVDTLAGLGTLVAVDPVAGWAEFKRGARLDPLPARAAGVPGPINDQTLRDSIQRTGQALLAGEATIGTALLAQTVPPAEQLVRRAGETAADVVLRVGQSLDGQVLAVQGPPGTGKTTAAARLIRALLDNGLRVGVTAGSHSVILNLLADVERPAWHKVSTDRGGSGTVVRLDEADGHESEEGEADGDARVRRASGAMSTVGAAGPGAAGPGAAVDPSAPSGRAGPAGDAGRAVHEPGPAGDAGRAAYEPGPEGLVRGEPDSAAIVAALGDGQIRLVGGTAWLWAREEFAESVDVLVIDEAGQFSLANAVAVAPAATRGLVLLGDPQQLTQPTQAAHPDGGGVSALEHLLTVDGTLHDTVPPERGIFLDRTYRMHPDLTRFVSELSYEERLLGADGLDRQRIALPKAGASTTSAPDQALAPASAVALASAEALGGSGLVWMPVEHEGCTTDSEVEARVVADLSRSLLTGTFTDARGETAPMTPADVLVVAPFNAQVARLRDVLPPGVRAGTVDKFQGRQAPVVIYSMASSSAELAPRGVTFLYDVHRLNVAISRAKALVVIVGSPMLLDAPVSNPEQLRAVNALCRFVEQARTVRAPESAKLSAGH
ncbi:putative RecB family nuclease [Kineosphaera limosa]|uniref:AAA+ ATPase domain-containing protein n=1 Tax=Kineosphaera limosa NBRC 100340 TaxID=1184609 RepID=K6WMM1_9MICO|nr:TM0106 family RecB-like putative nuclease [Kineosphaera limosa]NYE00478.1 putative RecB family nuclease [Kineosphaera limosa]GAB95056.1 hypothetical protein KILIM_015_01180 [Kineosphaera limosa NBRC 100340]